MKLLNTLLYYTQNIFHLSERACSKLIFLITSPLKTWVFFVLNFNLLTFHFVNIKKLLFFFIWDSVLLEGFFISPKHSLRSIFHSLIIYLNHLNILILKSLCQKLNFNKVLTQKMSRPHF
jgi:hypothetical protein